MAEPFWEHKGASLRHLHELIIPPDCFGDVWLCNSNCLERERAAKVGKQPAIKSQTAPEAAEEGSWHWGHALPHTASSAAETGTKSEVQRANAQLKNLLTRQKVRAWQKQYFKAEGEES